MSATEVVRCQIYRRLPDGNFTQRGTEFGCTAASGGWYVNRIGYGKLTAPAHLVWLTGTQANDLACVWTEADDWTQPRRVAQFIIQARQYQGDGTIELSGPNYLGALQDWIAFDRIGNDVTVTSAIEGFRPHPDIAVAPMAAYGPRHYTTHAAVTNAGNTRFGVSAPVYARPGDTLTIDFSTADIARELFVTEVTFVSDGRTAIEIADDLPYQLPANWPFTVYSKLVNVADASIFTIGERVKIAASSDGYNPLLIGTIANTEIVANNSDTITLANYIPIGIPIGYYAVSTSYSDPTLEDVEQLLENATGGIWRARRSPLGYMPTNYDPKGETVFQVLTSLAETSGWLFRLSMDDAAWLPRNQVDYFPDGYPYPTHSATNLDTLGTDNWTGPNYGEIIEIASENANAIVTHLVPFGGGSGDSRFTIAEADIGGILGNFPELAWGSDGINHYLFNKTFAGRLPKWQVETFPEIRPQNEASPTDRRNAANNLLWAACNWLRDNSRPDITYKVTCHTVADPRPGDQVIQLNYIGIEQFDIQLADMRVTEVHHEVSGPDGIRLTRLTLNKWSRGRMGGEDVVARQLRNLSRGQMATNAPSTGAALVTYEGATWQGPAALQSNTGGVGLLALGGEVNINATDGVTVSGSLMEVNTAINATGAIRTDTAVVIRADTEKQYRFTSGAIRGIPRLFATEGR